MVLGSLPTLLPPRHHPLPLQCQYCLRFHDLDPLQQALSVILTSSRWIKYEEDLEAERGQWGKPHVASLSFSSLVSLRRCLEDATMILDITVRDLPELLHRVVEDLSEKAIIQEEQKSKVLSSFLSKFPNL